MNWETVAGWLKANAGGLLGMAAAAATGGVGPAIIAMGSMVAEATGEHDPAAALAKLKADPETLVRLEEIAKRDEADIRANHRELLRMEYEDGQKAHAEQQQTIRGGDQAEDEYVRHTRPRMARQSWYAMAAYVVLLEVAKALGKGSGPVMEMALVIGAPALAYLGFRTLDKRGAMAGLAGMLGRK